MLAALAAAAGAAWLVLVLGFGQLRFVIFDPEAKTGIEVFLAIGQIFGAFVLAISPLQPSSIRLRWVAAGFLVFGIGNLGYGYIYPLLAHSPRLVTSMDGSIYVRTVGTLLCAVGLAAPRLMTFSRRTVAGCVAVALLVGILLVPMSRQLPAPLHETALAPAVEGGSVAGDDPGQVATIGSTISSRSAVFPGLTPWYFAVSLVPLAASVVAAWSATRRASSRGELGLWVVLALTLLAAAQLHSVFWPSMYSSVLTTTSVIRLAMVVAVIVGGLLELRTIIRQRDALLLAEQERVQQLEGLARLKSDFTSVVAHELANPIAAIKAMSALVAIDDLPPDRRLRTANEIEHEAHILEMLVEDIRDTETLERDDFRLTPRSMSVARLVVDAAAYASRLPGTHPLTVDHAAETSVWGDPERLGQVIRNLLNNATRHTPEGTPITIRTRQVHDEVEIEVTDLGPGIPPEDIDRIFEKFGRGHNAARNHSSGRGLGLYLSRRIVQGHGSDLHVESVPGVGTAFRFRLKVMP